jgi:hypothetical protein
VVHFDANPEMQYPKMVERCKKKIEMKKKLSASNVNLWFSAAGKQSQKGKIKQAIDSEINASKLTAKSSTG